MIMACLLEVPQMLFESTLYTVNEELYWRKLSYVYGTVTTIIISSLVRIWLMSSTEWYFAPSHAIIIFAKYSSYFRTKSSIRSWRNIPNIVPLVFPFLTTTLSRLILEMAASTLYFSAGASWSIKAGYPFLIQAILEAVPLFMLNSSSWIILNPDWIALL